MISCGLINGIYPMPYTILSSGLSDMGLVRDNNEDVWAEISELNFYVLADGMGGHQAGEVASREAVSHLLRLVRKGFKTARKKTAQDLQKLLNASLIQVNNVVFKLSRSTPELKGMGTTLCALLFHEEEAILAHVGDSRIYRLRENVLEQITKDHSLFRELVDLGQLSEQVSSDFAYKNIITKAIGTEANIEPSVQIMEIRHNDVFLLCSDGLSDMLIAKEIEDILNVNGTLDNHVESLINAAKSHGGHDNITVVIVRVNEQNTIP